MRTEEDEREKVRAGRWVRQCLGPGGNALGQEAKQVQLSKRSPDSGSQLARSKPAKISSRELLVS